MSSKANKKTPLVPRLRFPEFLDAEPWEVKRLGEFLSESRIKGSKGDVAKKITVKLWGKGVFAKNKGIKGSANTQYYRRKSGQIIYSKLDFLNQAFGIIPPELDGYESTIDLPCFDVNDKADTFFVLEYIKRKDFYKKVGEIADGSRKAKRIHQETFLSFPVFFPPLPEQQKIADCLSSLDEMIDLEAQKLNALKAHKKGLMQQLFPAEGETTPRLRFSEFQDAGPWKVKRLGELYEFLPTNSLSRKKLNYIGGPVKNIHYGDIHTKFPSLFDITREDIPFLDPSVDIENISPDAFCKEGDMIFADASEDIDDIGKTIELVNLNGEKLVSGLHTILARQKIPILIVGFGGYLFASTVIRDQIKREAQGAKVLGISSGRLSKIHVYYPKHKKEQQKIADCLSSLDEVIELQTKKLEALKAHKKGLMQELFPSEVA